jgi:hypothetical protein
MAAIKTPQGEFSMKNEDLFMLGLAGAALLWFISRNATSIGVAAGTAAANAAGGVVIGATSAFIPSVNYQHAMDLMTAYDASTSQWDKAGYALDLSFYLPAGDLFKWENDHSYRPQPF